MRSSSSTVLGSAVQAAPAGLPEGAGTDSSPAEAGSAPSAVTAAHASASAMRKRLAMVTLREERTRLAAERGSAFTCEHGLGFGFRAVAARAAFFLCGRGRAAAWASLGWCGQQAERQGRDAGRAGGRGGYRCVVSG